MQNITTIFELKIAIQSLEAEQAVKEKLLREQFLLTYDSLRPVNLIKGTIKDIISSPDLLGNILGSTIGLATGYLSKKIVVGTSDNKFKKLMGSVLQFGVTNLVAQHPDPIKSFSRTILKNIFRKKERVPKKP